jgi:hypothetical protein
MRIAAGPPQWRRKAGLRDVLDFEEQVRAGIIPSGIRPNPPKDAPPLRVVENQQEARFR